jgi:hypothetical protein
MSFATLGCRVPGIIITDKDCVDKTFPAFWVAIRNQLSVQLEPANVDLGSSAFVINMTLLAYHLALTLLFC